MCNLRKFVEKNYEIEELKEMAEHGISSGFTGLMYYEETTAIYQKYEEEVLDILDDVEYQDDTSDGIPPLATLMNNRVWAAIEYIASDIVNESDDEEK